MLELQAQGDQLIGKFYEPKLDGLELTVTEFTGRKIPPVPPAPDLSKLKFGKPIAVFNGKDLTGWTLTDPKATTAGTSRTGSWLTSLSRSQDSPGPLRKPEDHREFRRFQPQTGGHGSERQ